MSKVDVFHNGWIDLVFEGRNQQYGAYQLRKQSPKTTVIALFSGISFLGLAVAIPVTINHFSGNETATVSPAPPHLMGVVEIDTDITLDEPELPKPAKLEPKTPAAAAPPVIDVVKFTSNLVATSDPVENPPTQEQLLNANPGQENIQGAGENGNPLNTTGPGVPDGTGENPEGLITGNTVETTVTVDEMPEFPGGIKEFLTAVGRNYEVPESDEPQTAKVLVRFIVEKDGSISDIVVTRDPKPELGLGKEAIKALKRIKTKWTPGKKNGQYVRTAYNLPITVNIH
ncbi:MAG: energy transducer TonB [Flavobacterium sp.]